jgi:Glyoxalase-like domain
VELDHVILGVRDLRASAARLEEQHRLAASPGGRHDAAGTENWIVPLGDAYIELLAVTDPAVAAESPFGRWVADRVSDHDVWLGWCLRTGDLDGVAERHGLDVRFMDRPGGGRLSWRVAGLRQAWQHPELPFFIQWNVPDEELPGRTSRETQARDARIAAVEVGGDEHELRHWAGDLPGTVRLNDGSPGVHAVAVAGAGGVEVIRG